LSDADARRGDPVANLPGSVTGFIRLAMKSPSSFDGSHFSFVPVPGGP